jgi:drug/metabolite transporter (DMT)-like permease
MNAHGSGVSLALLAALLFGATTPLIAKSAAGVGAFTSAGLLYLGAALAAFSARLSRSAPLIAGHALSRRDRGIILGMALAGAAIAPVLLVLGLARTSPIAASLALNAEVLFTVVLAILVHREPWRGRVVWAVALMLAGGALLALDRGAAAAPGESLLGLLLVLLATLFWGLDNTLSRSVSEARPLSVVALKATLGATLTLTLAIAFGEPLPSLGASASLFAIGATGYGASLVVYLLAQRRLGAARTGSIFGVAPFVGALLALLLGARDAGWLTALGGLAFGAGVWLHAREPHAHAHVHEAVEHEHSHRHDDGHHDHRHDPPVTGAHSHRHVHARLEHVHGHAPDLHHRHPHP